MRKPRNYYYYLELKFGTILEDKIHIPSKKWLDNCIQYEIWLKHKIEKGYIKQ